jgi:outer membrane protein assembly factor BamB
MWPAVLIIIFQALITILPGRLAPGTIIQFMSMMWGPVLCAVALGLWWLFGSRLSWADRRFGIVAYVGAALVTVPFYHSSFAAMGSRFPTFGILLYSLPLVSIVSVAWLLLARFLSGRTPFFSGRLQRVGFVVVLLLGWGYLTLVRLDGVTGMLSGEMRYRWQPTPEEQFLAQSRPPQATIPAGDETEAAEALPLTPADWPSFRGPDRDGRLAGVKIPTNWNERPPRAVWRHRVGPGWSSFAAVGNRIYTQEQHGEEEAVICYDAATGKERWVHRDAVRFTETIAGPGPRSTPTFDSGKIYALGAAGTLNCLDAVTGRRFWKRDIVADSEAKIPTWGFSSSPLVVDGIVTVFAGGPEKRSVLGYHADSGELAWSAGEGKLSYCSLQLAEFDGTRQLLMTSDVGAAAFDPQSGAVLWQHDWPLEGMARCTQPAVVDGSDILIGTGFGNGLRRVQIRREGDKWTAKEAWTTRTMKPYYNDLVIHNGHAYGFDSNIFTCIDLTQKGQGKWKARGYGNGQVLLLADQNLLLILSETGEVALVEATSDGHKEHCRFQAIEGKTWNHPVLSRGRLFVRNGEEAACYELAPENDSATESEI